MRTPFSRKDLAVLLVLLAACGAQPVAGDELWYGSVEMIRSDGGRARIMFGTRNDIVFEGVMRHDIMSGTGTYTVSHGVFCYQATFPGKECWRYPQPLRLDQPTVLKSTDGSLQATFTLRAQHSARRPA